MAINGIVQPELIVIDEDIRLRKFDGVYDFALAWYQDPELVYLVDGRKEPYDLKQLGRMYQYLDRVGELYFIEIREGDCFWPVGDVTFWQEDMPIVIGEASLQGKGIGKKILSALIRRGKELGYDHLRVREIYDWNEVSQKCFESLGFRRTEKTEKGASYRLDL